ncbi:MAG: zinc-dependent alcohol dehydrogenase family protein [Egibacteraceae bacterium]
MRAWIVDQPGPIAAGPLRLVDRSVPEPGLGEVRVRVRTCGVCRTDLHLAEGDLPPRRHGVVPGHEIVGIVDAAGPGASRFALGDRIGVAWLRQVCGVCRFCERGGEGARNPRGDPGDAPDSRENLCVAPRFTGWDDDGGYAEHALIDEAYAYPLPDAFDDDHAAPLLCAGIIGYRALRRAQLPPGGRLGIYGFGASAHLAAQVAIFEGATVHVVTRSAAARRHALELSAASARAPDQGPPEPLDAAITFAPAGGVVPAALAALDRGGTLAIAGIHLTDIPTLRYAEHLFGERAVVSVTANTRADGQAFLALAAQIPVKVEVTPFALAEADAALRALAAGQIHGAGVLRVPG